MGRRMLGLTSFFCSSSLNTSTFMSGSFTYLRLLRHLSFSSCFSSLYVNTSHVSNTLQLPSILRTAIGTCSSDRTATISIKDHCFRSTVASLDTKGDFIKTLPVDLSPAIKCSVENSSFYPNVSIIPFPYKRRIVFANQTSHFKLSLGRESGLCSPSIEDLSYAGHLSNPTQAFKKLKRLRFKQFSRLNLHLCVQSSGLQLSSYSSSSVSNSTRRRDSSTYPPRAANNACKTGSSRGRYYPPRTYAPSSANGSAPPAQELPFEYQYSYSEIPKVAPIGFREPPYSPFGPSTLPRPWTGRGPLQKSKKKGKEIDSFNPPPPGKKGVKPVDPPGPFLEGQAPKLARTREEILGEPLTKEEVNDLVESCNRENRQINLGRDGLTHNMLEVIHLHWKRRRSVKIRCKGVPTMDMDNVCFHLEDKTGGKIIHRIGGTVHLFRGRNYNTRFRPKIPLMLWKPAAPIYPRLIKRIPDGLTKEEAMEMQKRGRKVQPLCKLARNGVYLNLVKDVKEAFEVDELVRIDSKGMNPSDYKKIGAKLRDMVPCVLISFEREQILMWRGRDRKSVCPVNPEISAEKASAENTLKASTTSTTPEKGQERINEFGFPPSEFELLKENNLGAARASANASEVDKLWQQALDDGVASLLDENGHAISLTEGADIHVSATKDEPSSFTDQTASRLTNDKTINYAGNSATSQKVLPVEELAKLLAS